MGDLLLCLRRDYPASSVDWSRATVLCSFLLLLGTCAAPPETSDTKSATLRLIETDGDYEVRQNGNPVLVYNAAPDLPAGLNEHYRRSGYFHPLYSPGGRVVTDGFPADYAHHHGIFTAWTKTKFRGEETDFWNTQKELATVRHVATERLDTAGDGKGLTFQTRLEHLALRGGDSIPVLSEELTVLAHDRADVFVWDLHSRQRNVSTDTLFLLEHVYGGLGVRGNKAWNPKDTLNYTGPAAFLTSLGASREDGNHTRPEWAAIYGEVDGGTAGLAVLPHPDNLRYPVPVRLHPSLPYFSVSPVVVGDTLLAPGQTFVNRYRIVSFDGTPPVDMLNSLHW